MDDVRKGKDFSFPKQEERILDLWSEIKAFETQLVRTKKNSEYIFYDVPPFATGLPHYGHILAGTIKDIVTHYQAMKGNHVGRRFGWDCHGLPVENEIDKKLGIKKREDILKLGIDKYNEECRSILTRYVEEWEKVITRTGRWIDFKNDYKTMDLKFMESVWWVFAQLYDKGLVYKSFKVMPYSTGCKTPISNFEAGQNYKESYIRDAIGSQLLPYFMMPPHAVVRGEEKFHGISSMSFGITLARRALMFNSKGILSLFTVTGEAKFGHNLQTYLLSRDNSNLKSEFQVGNGKKIIDSIESNLLWKWFLVSTYFLQWGTTILLQKLTYSVSRWIALSS